MSRIDRETVRYVARLARLRLDDSEEARIAGELARILDHVAILDGLPADAGREPSPRAPAPLRADEVTNPSRAEAMLRTAPDRDGDLIRVPAVLEGD